MPKCVHKAWVAGGVGFLCAACSVNVQHRDETRCQLTLCSLQVLMTADVPSRRRVMCRWTVVHVQWGHQQPSRGNQEISATI